MADYIGIDPGKKGAIVKVYENGAVNAWKVPLTKEGEVDLARLCDILGLITKDDSLIGLENPHAIYGTSKGTMFTMGRVIGNIEAALTCNGANFCYVKPKEWQKIIWIDKDIVKKDKGSAKKKVRDTKATSLNAVKRLFPGVELRFDCTETPNNRRTKPHDGIVDALLIAEYVRRNNI